MSSCEELLKLEDELVFSRFTIDDALNLGLLFVKMAKDAGKGGVGIKIEKNGKVLFTHLMEGTSPENERWYDRKKNVVDRCYRSSKFVEEMYREQGATFAESGLLDPERFQAVGGSFPLIVAKASILSISRRTSIR